MPSVLRVELSLNGKDYTNDNQTYGFFDPYVLDVQPRLLSRDGSTKITISGFGFVDSNQIKTKFVAAKNESASTPLKISGSSNLPLKDALFIDSNHISCFTYPQSELVI